MAGIDELRGFSPPSINSNVLMMGFWRQKIDIVPTYLAAVDELHFEGWFLS